MTSSNHSCWICLDDDDEDGRPLLRDCSCRGESGWAHLACLVQYCETKSKEESEEHFPDKNRSFDAHWGQCSFCLQRYQGEVSLQLSQAFVDFVDKNYACPGEPVDGPTPEAIGRRINACKTGEEKAQVIKSTNPFHMQRLMDGYRLRLESICSMGGFKLTSRPQLKDEARDLIERILATVERAKAGLGHLAATEKEKDGSASIFGKLRTHTVGRYESYCHYQLSFLATVEGHHGKAIQHLERAKKLFLEVGLAKEARDMDFVIATARSRARESSSDLSKERVVYERAIEIDGESHTQTLRAGFQLISHLVRAHNNIEAERLATKLANVSRRVHGPEHDCTKIAEGRLKELKARYVVVDGTTDTFQALSYDEDTETYTVQGPINKSGPRYADDESQFTVSFDEIIPLRGCPVFFHGLVGAAHLNGMVGDVRDAHATKQRLVVHPEDESLKPVSVKPKNLRVAFDLPDLAMG